MHVRWLDQMWYCLFVDPSIRPQFFICECMEEIVNNLQKLKTLGLNVPVIFYNRFFHFLALKLEFCRNANAQYWRDCSAPCPTISEPKSHHWRRLNIV